MRKSTLRKLKTLGLIALIFAVFFIMITLFGGEHHNEKLEGATYKVTWDYVNLRSEPSLKAEIMYRLLGGSEVTLTGDTFTILGGDGKAHDELWYEVITKKGDIGWITADATE